MLSLFDSISSNLDLVICELCVLFLISSCVFISPLELISQPLRNALSFSFNTWLLVISSLWFVIIKRPLFLSFILEWDFLRSKILDCQLFPFSILKIQFYCILTIFLYFFSCCKVTLQFYYCPLMVIYLPPITSFEFLLFLVFFTFKVTVYMKF